MSDEDQNIIMPVSPAKEETNELTETVEVIKSGSATQTTEITPAEPKIETPVSRTVVDILLSIEKHMEMMVRLVSLQDMSNKLIIDKMNKFHGLWTELAKDPNQPQEEKKFLTVKADAVKIQTETDPKGVRRNGRAPAAPIPEEEEDEEVIPTRTANNGKKYQVTQRLCDSTGKNLFMAKVEFLDKDGTIVTKASSDASGKFTASVPVGEYTIKITKNARGEDGGTKKLEATQKITIDGNNPVTSLPIIIIK